MLAGWCTFGCSTGGGAVGGGLGPGESGRWSLVLAGAAPGAKQALARNRRDSAGDGRSVEKAVWAHLGAGLDWGGMGARGEPEWSAELVLRREKSGATNWSRLWPILNPAGLFGGGRPGWRRLGAVWLLRRQAFVGLERCREHGLGGNCPYGQILRDHAHVGPRPGGIDQLCSWRSVCLSQQPDAGGEWGSAAGYHVSEVPVLTAQGLRSTPSTRCHSSHRAASRPMRSAIVAVDHPPGPLRPCQAPAQSSSPSGADSSSNGVVARPRG